MTPAPRHIGGERFEVTGMLGEGAQGVTYAAIETATGRPVAIKRFEVRGARSWKDVELAEREARVLATLDHPLMPRYLCHFEEDGALYLAMEKVEGETLDAILRRQGALPEDEVLRFLACADRALTYLHGRGAPVVHRDIKPRNVIRRADGSYVLVDFGAVSELVARRGSSTIVGTIGYMAPEQFQGRATPASDVYAVGATALTALTGKEPETLELRGLRINVRAALGDRVSPHTVASLEKMLEPDPDLRAPSLAVALERPSLRPQAPMMLAPAPTAAVVPVNPGEEDVQVKSIRNLLWVLWGLGWVIVPLLRLGHLTPVIMFGSLALLIIVTWHKGAAIRAMLRAVRGTAPAAAAQLPAQQQRVRVDSGPAAQVRVQTSDLRPEEALDATHVDTQQAQGEARRMRH